MKTCDPFGCDLLFVKNKNWPFKTFSQHLFHKLKPFLYGDYNWSKSGQGGSKGCARMTRKEDFLNIQYSALMRYHAPPHRKSMESLFGSIFLI